MNRLQFSLHLELVVLFSSQKWAVPICCKTMWKLIRVLRARSWPKICNLKLLRSCSKTSRRRRKRVWNKKESFKSKGWDGTICRLKFTTYPQSRRIFLERSKLREQSLKLSWTIISLRVKTHGIVLELLTIRNVCKSLTHRLSKFWNQSWT